MRRTDLVELLADVGLGGSMHSIVSQGKVEAVLASKPEERRELVEEAAGLGKFKRRKHRAELKLARVGIQVERARDVEAEVRKRLRPLALQATAAERAERLCGRGGGAAGAGRRARSRGGRRAARRGGGAARRRLRWPDGARTSGCRRCSPSARRSRRSWPTQPGGARLPMKAHYRLQGAAERVAVRREGAGALLERLRADLGRAELSAAERTDERLRALEAAAAEATAAARTAAAASGAGAERARAAQERLAALERGAAARAEERLERLRAEREALEAELAGVAGGREGATRTLYRLGGVRERVALRGEAAAALRERLRVELAEAEAAAKRPGPSPEELRLAADDAVAAARAAAHERDELDARAALAEERLAALELSLAEREGLPPAARALAEEGATLALSLLEVEAGSERAVAAALGWRAGAVVADDAEAGLALLERARAAGLGSLAVLVGSPERRIAELPVVPLERLLDSRVAAVTPEGYGFDPARGELWFAGETAEAVLLELEARRRVLKAEAAELKHSAQAAAAAAAVAGERAAEAEAAYAQVAHLRGAQVLAPALLRRLAAGAAALDEVLLAAAAIGTRLEDALNGRAAAVGGELARVGALEHEARQAGGASRTKRPPARSSCVRGSAARNRSGSCTSTSPSARRSSARRAS